MSPLVQSGFRTIYQGCALAVLPSLEAQSVQCCVTSPPYWGLRDYGVAGQLGLEKTPDEYVAKLVAIFREVRRVLADDGTLWLNLGDSYAASGKGGNPAHSPHKKQGTNRGSETFVKSKRLARGSGRYGGGNMPAVGCKPKDLVGIPWMVAFALRADGWYLRSDIIWAKPNCMPESVTDRPTRSHEYFFLLSKSARYFYDAEAIKEPCSESFINDSRWETGPTPENEKNGYDKAGAQNPKSVHRVFGSPKHKAYRGLFKDSGTYNGKNSEPDKQSGHGRRHEGFNGRWDDAEAEGKTAMVRNKRGVWTVPPANYPDAHFATFPPKLIEPCILAGSRVGDTVLDPFGGSGTTGEVAISHGRKAVLIELNPDYIKLADKRTDIGYQPPLFNAA